MSPCTHQQSQTAFSHCFPIAFRPRRRQLSSNGDQTPRQRGGILDPMQRPKVSSSQEPEAKHGQSPSSRRKFEVADKRIRFVGSKAMMMPLAGWVASRPNGLKEEVLMARELWSCSVCSDLPLSSCSIYIWLARRIHHVMYSSIDNSFIYRLRL